MNNGLTVSVFLKCQVNAGRRALFGGHHLRASAVPMAGRFSPIISFGYKDSGLSFIISFTASNGFIFLFADLREER